MVLTSRRGLARSRGWWRRRSSAGAADKELLPLRTHENLLLQGELRCAISFTFCCGFSYVLPSFCGTFGGSSHNICDLFAATLCWYFEGSLRSSSDGGDCAGVVATCSGFKRWHADQNAIYGARSHLHLFVERSASFSSCVSSCLFLSLPSRRNVC